MMRTAIDDVEEYWNELRRMRPVPQRADIDPRRISRALENTFILERIAPTVARFRLAGTHLNAVNGGEVRGLQLTSFFQSQHRHTVAKALQHLFEEPAIVRLRLRAEGGLGRPKLIADLLLLPLVSDLGDVSRAIGCMVTTGTVGLTPRRFAVNRLQIRAIPEAAAPPVRETTVPSAYRSPIRSRTSIDRCDRIAPSLSRWRSAERPYLRLVRPEE